MTRAAEPDILTRAKALGAPKRKRVVTEDEIVLALAWMRGEIGMSQMARALKLATNNGTVILHAGLALREAYRQGRLKEVAK
jgi:hypothetical protein